MTKIIFNDYRSPAAEQAYEIAWDFLARSGAIRNDFETCVFLAQRITMMVEVRPYQPDSDGQSRDFRTPALQQEPRRAEEKPTGSSAWRRREALALVPITLQAAVPVIPDEAGHAVSCRT
jgi:hypothetical protein